MTTTRYAQEMSGSGNSELIEEDVGHAMVKMLTGMNNDFLEFPRAAE